MQTLSNTSSGKTKHSVVGRPISGFSDDFIKWKTNRRKEIQSNKDFQDISSDSEILLSPTA